MFKSIFSFFMSLIISLCVALDIPCYPMGEKLDLDKFELTFEDNFEGEVNDYQEYHALIVEHAKNYYFKKPYGANDNILNNFKVK